LHIVSAVFCPKFIKIRIKLCFRRCPKLNKIHCEHYLFSAVLRKKFIKNTLNNIALVCVQYLLKRIEVFLQPFLPKINEIRSEQFFGYFVQKQSIYKLNSFVQPLLSKIDWNTQWTVFSSLLSKDYQNTHWTIFPAVVVQNWPKYSVTRNIYVCIIYYCSAFPAA
jgi:hypothetical protein